jgi:hypothetical protein
MNDEHPFEQYLSERAAHLDVPSAGRSAIVERAVRRRHRRRTGAVAGLAAVALVGGAVVVGQSRQRDGAEQIESFGTRVVESPLEWTTVDVTHGLGWLTDTVETGSGLYSLSTAPGAREQRGPNHLYASADGTEWTEASLPDGLHAGALAASADHVYAVGTAAAGGSVPVVRVASTTDVDGGWDQVDLPLDVAALGAGFPGKVYVAGTDVAAGPRGTVVAVQVSAMVDVDRLLPGAEADGWWAEADGLHRSTCPPDLAQSTTTANPDAVVPYDKGSDQCAAAQNEHRTWAELGADPSVGELLAGRTYVFSQADGSTFSQTAVVPGAGFGTEVQQVGDGFRLLFSVNDGGKPSRTQSWSSADGTTWSPDAEIVDGWLMAAGTIGDRPAFVTVTDAGMALLHLAGPGGASTIDVNQALGVDGNPGVGEASFGPLGAAFVRSDQGGDRQRVAFTADGTSWTVSELPEAPAGMRQTLSGITVTADAVKVRLSLRPVGDQSGEGPSAQRLFVGTPA